jgi:hypothetical protein
MTPDEAVPRRTATGWRVGGEEVPDLTSAMVLADLLAADLSSEEQGQTLGLAPSGPPAPASQAGVPPHGAGTGGAAEDVAGAPGAETPGPGPGTAGPGTAGPGTAGPGTAGPGMAGTRTDGAETPAADAEQLKETVAQLERALTVRVRVEQAIGVLAERHKLRPRQAFELLRSASRARGARVSQTASEVVASVTNPLLRIPEELARQPDAHRGRTPRHSRRKA